MNQVAYWAVALFATLQFFTGLSMKGFWAWILSFSFAIVLWSAAWFLIAKLHNLLSSVNRPSAIHKPLLVTNCLQYSQPCRS